MTSWFLTGRRKLLILSASKAFEAGSKKRVAAGELKETAPKKAKGNAPSGSQQDPKVQFLRRAEAANFLTRSTPAVHLPPPDGLLESEAYAEAASNLSSVSFLSVHIAREEDTWFLHMFFFISVYRVLQQDRLAL